MEKMQQAPMGNSYPPTSQFRTVFASLSLHMSDRVRLLGFPNAVIDQIRQIIPQSWPKGIQAERPYEASHEFKLYGNPWSGQGSDGVHARRFMYRVFETLANMGWVLLLSTDISKRVTDKDTLLFRLQQPSPAPCDWMCISFSRSDRIRFIDAPPELVQSMIQALAQRIQSHGPHKESGVYELKLHGYPWRATGKETMETRRLLLTLLEVLEGSGESVYASIDQKQNLSNNESSETDTWHCCRAKNWMPGMPVFHGR